MRVHFVIHESFESAGAYLPWAESRGYTITWSHVYAGEAVPANADGFDMLVVFGGYCSALNGIYEGCSSGVRLKDV